MDIVKSYELPMIRCFNCNKPLAHLFEKYKNLLEIMGETEKIKIYEILNIKNPCCREKITFPEIIIINKPDENAILGIKKIIPKPKLTQLQVTKINENVKIITNEEKISIPIRCAVGHKQKKISDDLYISYVNESVYIAQ